MLKPAKPTKARTGHTKADTSARDADRLKDFSNDAAEAIQALEAKLGDEAALRAGVIDLAATGRKSEADALQVLVDKYPALKAQVRDVAIAEQERRRAKRLR